MTSVIIAAHNEAGVIGACLDALRAVDHLELIVVANGCTDSTASAASRSGVTVIDLPEPGKARALNAGDARATGYPRAYLDADIVVPQGGIAGLERVLAGAPSVLAVVPRRRLSQAGRPFAVRAYFAINERLPAFQKGLFGRGLIMLSEAGRTRFDRFPELIADDLFLDSQFSDAEKTIADDVEVVIEAPYTTRDLLRRLVRVRRGNAQMRAAAAAGAADVQVRPSDPWAWLRDVVLREPGLVWAVVPYLGLTLAAAMLARRSPSGNEWGRDESTRRSPTAPGGGPR